MGVFFAMEGGKAAQVLFMGEGALDGVPFDFQYRAVFVFEEKILFSDFGYIPIGRGVESNSVPGRLLPSNRHGYSPLDHIIEVL